MAVGIENAVVVKVVVQDVVSGREAHSFMTAHDVREGISAYAVEKGLSLVGRLIGHGEEVGFVANGGEVVGIASLA